MDLLTEKDIKVQEKGPWKAVIYTKGIALQSDDFHHDVTLYISGDFADQDQKWKYAIMLADRMNRMPQEQLCHSS